jgi:hypothetical protein
MMGRHLSIRHSFSLISGSGVLLVRQNVLIEWVD